MQHIHLNAKYYLCNCLFCLNYFMFLSRCGKLGKCVKWNFLEYEILRELSQKEILNHNLKKSKLVLFMNRIKNVLLLKLWTDKLKEVLSCWYLAIFYQEFINKRNLSKHQSCLGISWHIFAAAWHHQAKKNFWKLKKCDAEFYSMLKISTSIWMQSNAKAGQNLFFSLFLLLIARFRWENEKMSHRSVQYVLRLFTKRLSNI